MQGALTQFASSQAAQGDILATLGIDVKLLVLQTIAFLLLLVVLSKFVFPRIGAMLDARDKAIDESLQAAQEASQRAEESQAEVDKMLKKARREAGDIVATAKAESEAMVADAETKAKVSADRIAASAREDIDKEIVAARKTLHNETIELIAAATEKVLGSHVDAKIDKKVIEAGLREVR